MSVASHKMHEPCLLNHSRETIKHKKLDPIDEVFEDVDVDIEFIPDVGRGPSFPLSSEKWVIENTFAHIDERDTGKEEPCMSQKEMDAQMNEELDKEPSLADIPLPRGEDGWTTPTLLFGSQSFETMAPEFNPCIDLTNAPSWPNMEALLESPDSGHNSSRSAADQLVHNGGKPRPINMRSGENRITYEMESSDTETTFSRENSPVSVPDKPMSDPVRKHSFNLTPAGQGPIHDQKTKRVRFLPVLTCEWRLNRIKESEKKKEIEKQKKKTQAKKIGKENQISVEVEGNNKCDHSSGTRNRRQSIKVSSMSRNESLRRSVRIETRQRRLTFGVFKSLPKNS